MADSNVADTWERGLPYERYVGRWSRRVAPKFLEWLRVPRGRRWVDIGCGTGALCAAIVERCEPSSVVGVEPSTGFLDTARAALGDRVAFVHGSASDVPLEAGAADVVVSGLVLNFVPEPRAAMTELVRVTAQGGTIAAYVWDYAGTMDLIRHFFDAAAELDPRAAALDEGLRFALCRPDALRALFTDAGLTAVDTTALDIDMPFASFDDYWQPFLGGQGPAPAYAMSLDEPARTKLRERLRERLPIAPDGTLPMRARAWAVRGRV